MLNMFVLRQKYNALAIQVFNLSKFWIEYLQESS